MSSINLPVRLTNHAKERYLERVRPGMSWDQVDNEIQAVVSHGRITTEAPEWLRDRARQSAPLYFEIGDSIVMPLALDTDGRGFGALTCITRGGLSAQARERRNRERRLARRRTSIR